MKQSREKELLKKTAIITVGRVSTQFLSFLLLPLYTTLLSTKEYGTVDLITTLVQLLIPVVSLMIDQGVFRNLLNCNTYEEIARVISGAFVVLTGFVGIFVVIYVPICCLFSYSYKLWLLSILIVTAYTNLFLQTARGLGQTTDYALGSFVCAFVTIISNIVCIAFLHMGAVGMLIGTFLGNEICSLFLLYKLRFFRYVSFRYIDMMIVKDELKYSLPLIPNQLSLWVMNSSDRLIVSAVLGTAANGILSVSHKFPAIYMTLFNVFQLAWHETGASHYQDEDRNVYFSEMLGKVVSFFSTLCMGIIVILPLTFEMFVNSAYKEAYYNIPIYLSASLFNVVVGFLGVVYVATKRTAEIAKTTMIAAVINIVANMALINFVGLFAESISTFLSYFVTMIYRIIDTKRYVKIKYNIKEYILILIALVVCSAIYYLNNKIVSLFFCPVFIGACVWANRTMLKEIFSFIKTKMDK